MRALVVLVHYFRSEADPRHASVDESRRSDRRDAIQRVIQGYRAAFAPFSTLQFNPKSYEVSPRDLSVDIRVLTVPGCSLLEDDFRKRYNVGQVLTEPANPRMLGFEAYKVFAKAAADYDWFIFSEDDLRIADPLLFDKLGWFNQTFGDSRVLSPNRFESNPRARTAKTYIDGDLSAPTFARLTAPHPDQDTLSGAPFGRAMTFRRARNPHSGWFAITRNQLERWIAAPHWLDYDTSFVSPLESAATLGLTKTFAVYKPADGDAGFLEVEHLDNRFSGFNFPYQSRQD